MEPEKLTVSDIAAEEAIRAEMTALDPYILRAVLNVERFVVRGSDSRTHILHRKVRRVTTRKSVPEDAFIDSMSKSVRAALNVANPELYPVGTTGIAATQEDESILQQIISALDQAHDVAQEVIAAADRNLRVLEDCTRELQTTVNIVRWSNEFSAARSTQAAESLPI